MFPRKAKKELAPLPAYEPPGDEQIIVWAEDQGRPFVLAIVEELIQAESRDPPQSL